MFTLHLLSRLVVGLLTVWVIYSSLGTFFGVGIYFPFTITEANEIPEHRWQSVRIGVFLAFAYYGVMYIFYESKKVYPIHFLKVLLLSLSFSGLVIFYRTDVELNEYLVLISWFAFGLITHFASQPSIRRYFSKK